MVDAGDEPNTDDSTEAPVDWPLDPWGSYRPQRATDDAQCHVDGCAGAAVHLLRPAIEADGRADIDLPGVDPDAVDDGETVPRAIDDTCRRIDQGRPYGTTATV